MSEIDRILINRTTYTDGGEFVRDGLGLPVANVWDLPCGRNATAANGYGHLFAAAPDLYEACVNALDVFTAIRKSAARYDRDRGIADCSGRIIAAIRKAHGVDCGEDCD